MVTWPECHYNEKMCFGEAGVVFIYRFEKHAVAVKSFLSSGKPFCLFLSFDTR